MWYKQTSNNLYFLLPCTVCMCVAVIALTYLALLVKFHLETEGHSRGKATGSIQLAASLGKNGADFMSVYIKHCVSVSPLAGWRHGQLFMLPYILGSFTAGQRYCCLYTIFPLAHKPKCLLSDVCFVLVLYWYYKSYAL